MEAGGGQFWTPFDTEGGPSWEVRQQDYADAVKSIRAAWGHAPMGTSFMSDHENGPDIVLNGASLERGRTFALDVQRTLTPLVDRHHPGSSFVLVPPGEHWMEGADLNLKVEMPASGTRALAGFLGDTPAVRLERFGQLGPDALAKSWSVNDLAVQPWQEVKPGSYRLIVDFPWGAAVETLSVSNTRTTSALPIPPGEPPLRNRLTARKIAAIQHNEPRFWIPGQGAADLDAEQLGVEHLEAWTGGTILATEASEVRVEPFSTLPWPAWDQLFGAVRLQDVDLSNAHATLAKAKAGEADVELLKLALGYVAWARGDLSTLKALLPEIGAGLKRSTDWRLLSLMAHQSHTDEVLDPPLLRWGVGLGQLVAPKTRLPGIASPMSAWALYQCAPATVEVARYAEA